MNRRLLAGALLAWSAAPLLAGSYWDVVRRTRAVAPTDPQWVGPYAIVHPFSYDGTGGELRVRVCAAPSAEPLIGPLQDALRVWNELEPVAANCSDCYVYGDPIADPPQPYNARGSLLHELGHCAMGLAHINLQETENTPVFFGRALATLTTMASAARPRTSRRRPMRPM